MQLFTRILGCILLYLSTAVILPAQDQASLFYYLPNISYDPAVPDPASFFGQNIGDRHLTHDEILLYIRRLSVVNKRVQLLEYGRTHEGRSLVCLVITSPDNQQRLESIKAQRQRIADPLEVDPPDPAALPAVWYAGYSIHGNEASGSHAALLFAYYLLAAQTPEVDEFLNHTVVLLDPCFNPDGLQRFSGWVGTRRSLHTATDPAADEFNEPWPRGRTNHYWFDLNRDWLVMQQPESPGRVGLFQAWKPNVLTDHHEMGSQSSFFFQPGVPSRVNPLTPSRNQELTGKIATYHAELLSKNGIAFFSEENYDDFYYGKGSTYPDVHGCIGILFEQASSRGSAQETHNGLLSFPYTIRNQVFSSLSTMQAVKTLRVELNAWLRDFYRESMQSARQSDCKAYVLGHPEGPAALQALREILDRHGINWYGLAQAVTLSNRTFQPGKALVIPLEQAQNRLIRGMFSRETQFADSIFYDISAWTLSYAMGLDFAEAYSKDLPERWTGAKQFLPPEEIVFLSKRTERPYAFLLSGTHPGIHTLLSKLFQKGIRCKIAMAPFQAAAQSWPAGTILVPVAAQNIPFENLENILTENRPPDLAVAAVSNGLTAAGPDLGSEQFKWLREPKAIMPTGTGLSPESAGEVWHLMDTRIGMPLTMVDVARFASINLADYNTLILPEGNYPSSMVERVRQFAQEGGTVIALGSALRWLKNAGLAQVQFRQTPGASESLRRPYSHLDEDRAALRIPGSILEAELDLSHPLCFGYHRQRLPMFVADTLFAEPAKNVYAMPAVFSARPLLAGYLHAKHQRLVSNAVAVGVYGYGRGRIVFFAGNPNFRAFWYGTNRLFLNAMFFGELIDRDAMERKN